MAATANPVKSGAAGSAIFAAIAGSRAATTATVGKTPVLVVPPFINKYYILTSSPTLALRVTGGGFPLLGDSCSRSTGFLLHRAA